MKHIEVYFGLFFDQIIPEQLCLLCGQHHAARLCSGCRADLPWLGAQCRQCAEPLPTAEGEGLLCGRCLRRPPAFERCLAPFSYRFPINHLVWGLKDRGDLGCLHLCAALFEERFGPQIRADPPELLIPVPLHPARRRQRGYNQAEEWARGLGERLGIAVDGHSCRRRLDTPHQQGLSAQQRRRNLKHAFELVPTFRARHIALVDDVITTGTTLDLLAGLFRRRGVARVQAWCIARTPGDRPR